MHGIAQAMNTEVDHTTKSELGRHAEQLGSGRCPSLLVLGLRKPVCQQRCLRYVCELAWGLRLVTSPKTGPASRSFARAVQMHRHDWQTIADDPCQTLAVDQAKDPLQAALSLV